MKILLTGGGTGGHITPILAVVSEIRKVVAEKGIEKLEFMLISPENDNGGSVFERGMSIKKIKAGKLRRYVSLKNIIDIF
ncbi:MAG: glycosyltransferase, partial [bacterium]|nr:glycosyltransferase [bacterium]